MMIRILARRKTDQGSSDCIADVPHRSDVLHWQIWCVWNEWDAKVEAEITAVLSKSKSEAAAFVVDGESPGISIETVAVNRGSIGTSTPELSYPAATGH